MAIATIGRRWRSLAMGAIMACAAMLASEHARARSADGEIRLDSRDWAVTCRKGGSGECVAIAYAAVDRSGVPQYMLRIARARSDAPLIVVFSPTFHFANASATITVRVDGRPPIQFPPGDGWRHAEAPNENALVEPVRAQRLIGEMRAGQQIGVAYVDKEGRIREATFSLRGLAGALGFIEETQSAGRPSEPPGRSPRVDWARGLQGFLPAIDACRRRSVLQIEQIATIWPFDNGSLGLVAVVSDGRRFVCRVRRDGSHVVEFRRPDVAESLPAEGPYFTPYGGRRPVGQCFEHLAKSDRNGAFIGWVSYDRCKQDASH